MSDHPTGDYEQKYVFPVAWADLIIDWLDYSCLPDPRFRRGSISSLYFDTPTLHSYWEKRNSDYLKSKARLRWYGNPEATPGQEDIVGFLEVKHKIGAMRHKVRLPCEVPARVLHGNLFEDSLIRSLPFRLMELDYRPPARLEPSLVVQYERRRFVEPLSSSRVAVDIKISCPQANRDIFPDVAPVGLDVGVLEIKGDERELPAVLIPIGGYITREAFSKYGRLCEALTQPISRRL